MVDCLRPRHDDGSGGGGGLLASLFGGAGDGDDKAAAKASASKLTKDLAGNLDIDSLGKNFGKFSGSDEKMDAEECVAHALSFCVALPLPPPSWFPNGHVAVRRLLPAGLIASTRPPI